MIYQRASFHLHNRTEYTMVLQRLLQTMPPNIRAWDQEVLQEQHKILFQWTQNNLIHWKSSRTVHRASATMVTSQEYQEFRTTSTHRVALQKPAPIRTRSIRPCNLHKKWSRSKLMVASRASLRHRKSSSWKSTKCWSKGITLNERHR